MTISPLERELILLKADFLEDSGDTHASEALRESLDGPIIVARPFDVPVFGPINYARPRVDAQVAESAPVAQRTGRTPGEGFIEAIPKDILAGRPGRQREDTGPRFAAPGDEYRASA